MSDARDPETDQPLPVVNDRPFVQDLVVADIEERKQHGIRKYGTALQSGNGRDMLQDAYEKALDLAIYLRGAIDERDQAVVGPPPPPPRPETLPTPRAAVLQPSRAFPFLPAMAVCVALVLVGCALIIGGELGWLQ